MNEVQKTQKTQKTQGRDMERRTDGSGESVAPQIDVFEDADGLTLLIDLPGVRKDAIDLRVEGNSLSVGGEINATTPDGMEPVYAEVQVARFNRSFTLSRDLDASRIEASNKDGVLRLRIPKTEAAQPRRIEVQSA